MADGKTRLTAAVAAKLPAAKPAADAEQVTRTVTPEGVEARSTSRRIRTVEDLLRHIEADLTLYVVVASEATKWEVATSGDNGPEVTELHRVFVRLRPKAGPTFSECVDAMLASASRAIRKPRHAAHKRRAGLWQVLPIADTHFGNYAWHGTTGGEDWDLSIAERAVTLAASELLAAGDSYKPARRTIAFVGDLFHYDSPAGTTTKGTPLERDGRLQKMIQVGADALIGVIEQSAAGCQTDVVLVHGNHDETLSWAFHRILLERFRRDKRVRVDEKYTGRKYLTHGRNLLGFAHGHRAKKRLPQLMALEAASQWASCQYREWHTAHFHSSAAEWSRPIETIDGVLTRTCPSLCSPDDWHAASGFLNTRQSMESFFYDPGGGVVATHISMKRLTDARAADK